MEIHIYAWHDCSHNTDWRFLFKSVKISADIVILDDLNVNRVNEGKENSGMDAMYNERLQKRMESLKRAVGNNQSHPVLFLNCATRSFLWNMSLDMLPRLLLLTGIAFPENERHQYFRYTPWLHGRSFDETQQFGSQHSCQTPWTGGITARPFYLRYCTTWWWKLGNLHSIVHSIHGNTQSRRYFSLNAIRSRWRYYAAARSGSGHAQSETRVGK